MNKFAKWMKNNHKVQLGVADELGIAQSTLHAIMKKGQMPNLKTAYAIEIYTKGQIKLYDWLDEVKEDKKKK